MGLWSKDTRLSYLYSVWYCWFLNNNNNNPVGERMRMRIIVAGRSFPGRHSQYSCILMGKTCQSSTQCFSEVSHNYVSYFVQYFWCSSTGILLWLANFSSPLTIIKVWNTSLGAPGALTNHHQHHPRHQLLNQQARHCQISSGQMHFWGNRLTVIFFMLPISATTSTIT